MPGERNPSGKPPFVTTVSGELARVARDTESGVPVQQLGMDLCPTEGRGGLCVSGRPRRPLNLAVDTWPAPRQQTVPRAGHEAALRGTLATRIVSFPEVTNHPSGRGSSRNAAVTLCEKSSMRAITRGSRIDREFRDGWQDARDQEHVAVLGNLYIVAPAVCARDFKPGRSLRAL